MTVTLDNGTLRLEVNPRVGGSVVRFDALTKSGAVALMRPGQASESDPNQLAMYPLVPWSNRIAGGGFHWRGNDYTFAAELEGEPLPIHGDGWKREWHILEQTEQTLRLGLRSNEQPPFDYTAELCYCLNGTQLEVTLEVTHHGNTLVPYGLGLHPWFERREGTRIEASAEGVWEVDAAQLPTRWRHIATGEAWDFAKARTLPVDKIDNLFTGWNGHARLHLTQSNDLAQPGGALTLVVNAAPTVSRYLVFSPDQNANFFCFEPVDHDVNAHHFDNPSAHGLVELAEGETHTYRCCFNWVS
ncbi:aldose epimerase [Vreelandella venusta]|nr:aldose epimerase [Halomonas hydrothermalis]